MIFLCWFVFSGLEMGSEVENEAPADSPTSVLEDEVLFRSLD